MRVNTAGSVLIQGTVRQRRMTVSGVEILLPVLDDRPGFEETVEFVHVQALVANAIVGGFDVPVLPWLTGRNVADTDLVLTERPQRCGDELGSVVAPQHLRRAAPSANALSNTVTKSFAGMVLSTTLSTDWRVCSSTIDGTKELPSIRRRNRIGSRSPTQLSAHQSRRSGWSKHRHVLRILGPSPATFLAPETLNLLLVDHPAHATQAPHARRNRLTPILSRSVSRSKLVCDRHR